MTYILIYVLFNVMENQPQQIVSTEIVEESAYGYLTLEEKAKVFGIVKKSFKEILKQALVKNYISQGKHLIDHAVEVAYKDNFVLVALLKKIIPDKSGIEINHHLSPQDREAIVGRIRGIIKADELAVSLPLRQLPSASLPSDDHLIDKQES